MFTLRKILLFLLIAWALVGCAASETALHDRPEVVATSTSNPEPEIISVAPETDEPILTQAATAEPTLVPPTPQPTTDPDSPRAMIQNFYNWYFNQPNGEVLTKRTYNDHPKLSDIFKSDLNYLLGSFKDSSGYDPFTCAQNDLPSLNFTQMFVSGGSGYALAEVVIDNQVKHYFVIAVGTGEGTWKIDGIYCPREPQTAAIAFYTWYLGYIYGDVDVENGAEIRHNPIQDKAYQQSFLVTDAFVRKIDAELAAMKASGAMADPILNAQAVPIRFTVQLGATGSPVEVRLDYDVQSAHYHKLDLVEDLGGWKVDDIQHVEVPRFNLAADAAVDTAGWEEYKDEDYGFSLRFPREWSMKVENLSWQPADYPKRLGALFLAPGISTNSPVIWLDVIEGTEGQLINQYVTEVHQEEELNGLRIWIDRERCNTRFVFPHPSRENTWLVIGDNCPSMPGREKQLKALDGIMVPIILTVSFE